jgi:syntaxin-binding protein 5
MVEQMKLEDSERRKALREGRAPPPPEQGGSQEGYWSYMSRQVQERTERLNIVGDSMDRLEENSSGFANDVGKYVQSQKKKAVFGCKSICPPTGPTGLKCIVYPLA